MEVKLGVAVSQLPGLAARQRCRQGRMPATCCCPGREQEQAPPAASAPQVTLAAYTLKPVLAVAALGSAAGALAPAAAASRSDGWLPRRHHRRQWERQRRVDLGKLSQEVQARVAAQLPPGAQEKADSLAKQATHLASEVVTDTQRAVRSLQRSVQRGLRGDGSETISMRAIPSRPAGAGVQQRASVGAWALVVAVLAMAALLLRRLLGAGRRRPAQAGRWVADRSMGGKEIFVPSITTETEPRPAAVAREAVTDADLAAMRAAAPAAVPASGAAAAPGGEAALPDWWDAPPSIFVSDQYKQEASKKARALVREMERMKQVGRDFPVSSLVALRSLCAETGASVKPSTEAGRDAMLRAAAEAAAGAAMDEGSSRLAGTSPQRFCAGLARDLGVPDARAVTIVSAAVAAKARGTLIGACAALRAGEEQEALVQLLRLAGLLDTFPLAADAPQVELIAAGVAQRASVEERQDIFFLYGGMEPSTAGLVAVMLGFDPALVLPQLQQRLAGGQQAVGGAR